MRGQALGGISEETAEVTDRASEVAGVGHRSGLLYREWVVFESALMHSDKCTCAIDWNVWCCYEHDLACHYGKDPRIAFLFYQQNYPDYWLQAPYLLRKDADRRFWKCNRAQTPTLLGRLRSDIRYVGVRIGALIL